jgi:PAS domain S-box-containing protein
MAGERLGGGHGVAFIPQDRAEEQLISLRARKAHAASTPRDGSAIFLQSPVSGPEFPNAAARQPGAVSSFESLVSVLPGVVYQARFSPEGQARVEYMSDAARWFLEVEPADVVRNVEGFRNLIHPEDRARFLANVEAQRRRSGRWQLEYRLLLPSGKLRWISSHASVEAFADGSSVWRGFMTDVTAQKQTERELETARHRLELATRAGRIGTWDYDVSTRAIQWNDAMYEIHGVTPDTHDPNLADNLQFIVPEDRERVMTAFQNALDSDASRYSIDVTLLLPDGRKRLTRSHALILRDASGAATRVVGIEMDITEEHRAARALAEAKEAAESADRAKSEFLATMSHEIRTPMNGILGYAALLKNTPLQPEQAEYLDIIESSGEHLLHLINDILDVSKIEAGELKIDVAPFDVRECVREVFEMLRSVAERKNLSYVCAIDAELPSALVSDRDRLAQILANVLGNALKFTDSGEVRLAVGGCPAGAGEWLWEFRISDTGAGIPPEALPHVFDRFFQANSSARRRHGGAGLGLAISHRLAELLNGSLSVQSRLGAGSEFRLTLRAAAISSMPKADAARMVSLEGPLRVLVVEDHAINRRLCALQLRNLGCDMQFAEDGLEAVQTFSRETFDVVLMDMQMPGLDGCEATREIRRLEKARAIRRTPIIAMTANARVEDRDSCLAAGMDDYLTKPLRHELLAAALSKWAPARDGSQ